MFRYEAHITCECVEKAFIDLFLFLGSALRHKKSMRFEPQQNPSFRFQFLDRTGALQPRVQKQDNANCSELEQFIGLSREVLEQTKIILTIKVNDDAGLDIFSYRYLFLITNQLLRKQDRVYFDCPDAYYHKIGSYLFLQTLPKDQKVLLLHKNGEKKKRLPQAFSLSPEWFPAIYLSNKDKALYEILANPLFRNTGELKAALDMCAEKANRLDFTDVACPKSMTAKGKYTEYLKCYFAGWIHEMLSELSIEERLCSVSGIAQLLFSILCKNIWKNADLLDKDKAEKLLDICCDFGDCIIQVAENIVSHTEGGVLSIRINDNWSKVKETFHIKEDVRSHWYMRISLVDFSENSILDNVRRKSGIEALTLSHIFMDSNPPSGIQLQEYRKTAEIYENYLNDSAHIIHHYGLSVFRNVVNQYGGCFTVISDSRNTTGHIDRYASHSEKISYIRADGSSHIPGSEYDILLLLDENLLKSKSQWSNPSLLLKPKYIVPSVTKRIIFKQAIYDYFNTPLSDIIRRVNREYDLPYQQLKEHVVENSARQLAEKLCSEILGEIEDNVFYFYLSDVSEQVFGRSEIVAKIILQTIAELKKKLPQENREQEWLYIVIYGLSESKLAQFTRQFALFYHRREGNRLMEGCRLYAVSGNYRAEVMFAGVKLSVISDYNKSRRLVTGTSPGISKILAHIASRDKSGKDIVGYKELEAFPFELLNRMEPAEGKSGKEVTLSPHNKWYHQNLKTILYNDIHGGDLGCCLKDVHVRVGSIHLHTFFEGQLLFANTYWYQIFAHYICEMILNNPQIGKSKDILLYGYETYSEQMLFSATEKLQKNGRKVYYAVFENPKYITSAETSERRVRYIDRFLANCGQDICVVFVLGIGTTLATISERMREGLEDSFRERNKARLLEQAYKKGLIIIQVSGGNNDKQIKCDRSAYTVSSNMAKLDFLTEKKCHYLVEAQAKWYSAQECPHCLRAQSYLNELPLIQTNETSTVPMILIKPEGRAAARIKFKQRETYNEAFLKDPNSVEYLYYSHLNRAGNHYQFYIRTAALLNDYLQKEDKNLNAWFQEIRKNEVENPRESLNATQINIIVSPQHFSNESLVAAVNDRVFNGEAYIISFDAKKEFRDSFVAKFQNYHSALEMLYQDMIEVGDGILELNFYYVDDIILTGATFSRAKSLVSSMLGEFFRGHNKKKSGISVNLFKGIIVLVNRNSTETLCNYFVPDSLERDADGNLLLPIYCFIWLNTPAIRSYGDSCPICNKVERIRNLERESSLTYVERHWREKAEYHGLKKLSDAKSDKAIKNNAHQNDTFYKSRGLRRLQCSEAIWALIKKGTMTCKNAKDLLEGEIDGCLHRLDGPEEQVEYLISFLKIISREHVVYQETVQPAALKILLSIFSVFIGDNEIVLEGLYKTVNELINEEGLQPRFPYALYQMVIARLCAMGSTVLCRKKQLVACLKTGLQLEKNLGREASEAKESFSAFLCIQIKKMLFVTQDCSFRVTELQQVLRGCIGNELKKWEGSVDAGA